MAALERTRIIYGRLGEKKSQSKKFMSKIKKNMTNGPGKSEKFSIFEFSHLQIGHINRNANEREREK